MKTLMLWGALALAVEALLLWGLFAVVDAGLIFPASVAQALLVGTVSVLIWLGYKNGFLPTVHRLELAVLGCVLVTVGGLAVWVAVDLPTAVVCERGRTEIEATPHILGGRFEVYRVGPCTLYNPESRPVPGIRGGNAGGGD
jgi:hypothetical protein